MPAGSDTSSNALFGSLQTITAGRLVDDKVLPLSVGQASLLLATANSTGTVYILRLTDSSEQQ